MDALLALVGIVVLAELWRGQREAHYRNAVVAEKDRQLSSKDQLIFELRRDNDRLLEARAGEPTIDAEELDEEEEDDQKLLDNVFNDDDARTAAVAAEVEAAWPGADVRRGTDGVHYFYYETEIPNLSGSRLLTEIQDVLEKLEMRLHPMTINSQVVAGKLEFLLKDGYA